MIAGPVAALAAAGLALAPAGPAAPSAPGTPLELPGVPAAGLLARGRVLVLRPHRLEVALDGRVVRSVAVRQPVDVAALPALVGDADYAARLPGPATGVRLGAVRAQRPGTTLTASGVRLDLAGTGGAGPARLTGTRAALALRRSVVTASAGADAGHGPVGPGLRYLHASTVTLQDVVLDGLGGSTGAGTTAAVRADGGSTVALTRVAVTGGGDGVEVRDPAALVVDGLDADGVGGIVLDVRGGTGVRLRAVSSAGAAGAAVRVRGSAGASIEGLRSSGDATALTVADVVGLRAAGVRARGGGVVLAGRGVELVAPDVDAPLDALRVPAGAAVTVQGGTLRAGRAAVSAQGDVVLRDVGTAGRVAGRVRVEPDAGAVVPPGAGWWDRPVRGAGGVAVLVLVAGVLLELLRARRRDHGGSRPGPLDGAGGAPGNAGPGCDELVLDLGERWVR